MDASITGYSPLTVRCVYCQRVTHDPRIAPDGFACPACFEKRGKPPSAPTEPKEEEDA